MHVISMVDYGATTGNFSCVEEEGLTFRSLTVAQSSLFGLLPCNAFGCSAPGHVVPYLEAIRDVPQHHSSPTLGLVSLQNRKRRPDTTVTTESLNRRRHIRFLYRGKRQVTLEEPSCKKNLPEGFWIDTGTNLQIAGNMTCSYAKIKYWSL